MNRISIVVPCYNEAQRLNSDSFCDWLAQRPEVTMIFVDDGSTDRTLEVLTVLSQRVPERATLLKMPENRGKAEVVRRGLLHALATKSTIVGYLDADLATPLAEVDRLIEVMMRPEIQLVMGARVSLLGRHIERSSLRHYLGRAFASAASLVLGLGVYDTQCGAKLLRPSPALEAAIAVPFLSRWAFDVELLGRMMKPPNGTVALQPHQIVEEPLNEWHDVPGSKLDPLQMAHSVLDLLKIGFELRHRRRAD